MALRNERPVLETRLDADDGLHEHFIEYIQHVALKRFQPFGISLLGQQQQQQENKEEENKNNAAAPIPQWLYWCSRRHIEWHSDTDASLSETLKEKLGSVELGYMNVIQHDKLCVTPGITIGYNTNANSFSKKIVDVPQYDHDKLYKNVRNSLACYNNNEDTSSDQNEANGDGDGEIITKGPCLELVEDFIFCAIRSRTWTSAGMYNVNLVGKDVMLPHGNTSDQQQRELTQKLWALSKDSFGVTKTKVKETQNFLIRNKKLIAHENLLGQCQSGHSCKDTAKEELRRIID